ncbi:hypothetical protein [Streptomyces sp. NPDC092952]|uniref:hypothetical protein n=1 Tax=Streptomyces sp. NPDC092952 TaxID=3366018 RepID=UPI00382B088F
MSILDIPDVFIGSTDDEHTFVILNRRIRGADRLLTEAGFTARKVHGRTVYLLPPSSPEDAHEKAGVAMYGLLAHTHDLVDLALTTRWAPQEPTPTPAPDLRFMFTGSSLTATALTEKARSLLVQHGFVLSADGTYEPPRTEESSLLSAVVRSETHAYATGVTVRVDLGIPTPGAIPPPTRPTSPPVPGGPATGPGQHRTR